jgi:hypothetical protein
MNLFTKSSLFVFVFSSYALCQSVVVNKYFNSGVTSLAGAEDAVELLVIQNNLDLRGMIVKDFSSNMANDGGGRFELKNVPFWQSLKAGTLIIIRVLVSASSDTDPNDFVIDIGLSDTLYFRKKGTGTFDIATTDMIMIKSAGSSEEGVTGSIHVLAGGTAGTQFNNAPNPKLRAAGTSGTGRFVYANNSTSSISDFDGTDATGNAAGLTFGQGNNPTNVSFINSLRERVTSICNENILFPNEIVLYNNYPNPFNPSTVISYQLSAVSYVTLKVYDVLGREIVTLVEEYKEAGVYNSEFRIPNSAFTSGVYYYQLRTNKTTITKKMAVLR